MSDAPVTLITGTRKGIGKYLAEYYVSKGHIVVGCSRETPDWTLDGYSHYEVDVSDEKGMVQMFSAIRKHYGHLDNLINNAGIASMNHAVLTPVKKAKQIIDTNIIGTFIASREAAKLMQRHRYGRIVNFATEAVPMNIEGESLYASSKAAIISFSRILAKEVGTWGITVNVVGPPPIMTDLINHVPSNKIDLLLSRHAINKMGSFLDMSNTIDYFLAKESSMVTGQVIYLGGVF